MWYNIAAKSKRRKQMAHLWSKERIELLTKMWLDGLPASQIADTLGNVTRNGVIGKAHRLKLGKRRVHTGRDQDNKLALKKARRRIPSRQVILASLPQTLLKIVTKEGVLTENPVEEVVIPIRQRKSLIELTETCCRWPIGEPFDPDFHFCGRTRLKGVSFPYCEIHYRKAMDKSRKKAVGE